MHLGISVLHGATVAVIKDDKVVFVQSEERFNRIKNSSGIPALTLDHVYRAFGGPETVESATIYMNQAVFLYNMLAKQGFKSADFDFWLTREMIEESCKRRSEFSSHEQMQVWAQEQERSWAALEHDQALYEKAVAYFCDSLRISRDRLHFAPHHQTHAYSTLPNLKPLMRQGDGRALVFTLDGQGDMLCATVGVVDNQGYRVLSETDRVPSIGRLYHLTTGFLGMKMAEHEHKVMGLAAYSKAEHFAPLMERLERLLWVDDEGNWNSSFCCREDCIADLSDAYYLQRFDNVAGAIQGLLEKMVCRWIGYWTRKTGVHTIGCAGGVFMNVKANQRILELPTVERMFVMPSAGDESSAVGCAVMGALAANPAREIAPIGDIYLGVSYDDEEIAAFLQQSGAGERYVVRHLPDTISEVAADLLANGEVLSRCAGRMEFGARALGNRSILANPRDPRVVAFINEAVKSRDFWMPFAPSILEEDMGRYVVNHEKYDAPYMMATFDSTPEARRDLAAAMHAYDMTLRPQRVVRAWNPAYHALISAFKARTGVGGLLNTSFNLHGEPIVCTPADAVSTVDRSALKYLILGNYLLEKK